MKISGRIGILGAAAFSSALMLSSQAQAVGVDLELSLLVDVSGSVSTSEFALQRGGYVTAFQSAAVQNTIANGAIGSIAVNMVYWSSAGSQTEVVGWTQISDAASSNAFAANVAAAGRTSSGSTAVGSAIAFADPLFDNNGFEGTRNVIDVSGDGTQNSGVSTSGARDAFINGGGTAINGVVIGGSQAVFDWYVANVKGGASGFVLKADSFGDFEKVIQAKLIREIGGEIPIPAAAWLFGTGLIALGTMTRKRKA